MRVDSSGYEQALERAWEHTREWLRALPGRPVRPSNTADDVAALFGCPLPSSGRDPAAVIDFLAEHSEPG